MTEEQKRILVVEDEVETAELLAEMLGISGYSVLNSKLSQMAIDMIEEQPPDAIILDIMLPDFPGLEVLRFVRRDSQLSNIPVIVVSAKTMPADIKEGLDAGATKYLTKPVSFVDLKESVAEALQA